MEYVQERITTLHDLTDPVPAVDLDRATVVVPMTSRERGRESVDRTFSVLERCQPGRVIVPLRAPPRTAHDMFRWLSSYELPLTVLWCNGPELQRLLATAGLDGESGKGSDVWLALGVAADAGEYVAVHDADARDFTERNVSRLCWPLANGFTFSKGYYARFERGRLYGRLFRLFVSPLLDALGDAHDAPVIEYLDAFRYTLSGEFAMTAGMAQSIRSHRRWGLEIGTLGDAFDRAGFDGTAQVDLGVHRHDHRPVTGDGGLSSMADHVAGAIFTAVAERGVELDYETLPARYRECAQAVVGRYAVDAAFNDLAFDLADERAQIENYAGAIREPDRDDRLPTFREASIDATRVLEASRLDRERLMAAGRPQR